MSQLSLIEEEISNARNDVYEALVERIEAKKPALIVLGEMHSRVDRQRQLAGELVNYCGTNGYTVLALELSPSLQPALDEFSRTKDLNQLQTVFREQSIDRWFLRGYPEDNFMGMPDEDIFKMIVTANAHNMKLVCVDEARPIRGGFTGRDKTMATGVAGELNLGKKLILWGGYTHHYQRPNSSTENLTTVEILRNSFPELEIATIFGLTTQDHGDTLEPAAVETLPKLILTLDQSRIIDTQDSPAIRETRSSFLHRCSSGVCRFPSQGVCACGRTTTPAEGQHSALYGYWDFVILHAQGYRPTWFA